MKPSRASQRRTSPSVDASALENHHAPHLRPQSPDNPAGMEWRAAVSRPHAVEMPNTASDGIYRVYTAISTEKHCTQIRVNSDSTGHQPGDDDWKTQP